MEGTNTCFLVMCLPGVLIVPLYYHITFSNYMTVILCLNCFHHSCGSTLMDRVISVEYALRDDDEKRNGYSPERRGRDRSPDRRDYRGRSASPYGRGRERGSPDYGRGRERGSPDYGRGGDRGSPDYHRGASPQGGNKGDERGSPPNNYDRERREASPGYDRPRRFVC